MFDVFCKIGKLGLEEEDNNISKTLTYKTKSKLADDVENGIASFLEITKQEIEDVKVAIKQTETNMNETKDNLKREKRRIEKSM